MSLSTILSGLRGAGRQQVSGSTINLKQATGINLKQATGSHVLRIDGYTQVTKTVANGVAMRSDTFNVGGHDWRILCYPNGCFNEYKGYFSIFLEHASHARTGDARAKGQLRFVKHEDLDTERYLKDDCLTVLCDVTVEGYRTGEPASAPAPPFDSPAKLEEFTAKVDLNIEVGGEETFPAHRWVLESQSPVFKTELSLASTAADGTTRLRVDDMDAKVFKALLRFMYKLEKLKQVCEGALCRNIGINSVALILALAERHNYSALEAASVEFLTSPGNLEAVMAADGSKLLKAGCPSALAELVAKKIARQEH
ncbi:unnamed protein product [Alopecurus aequalis]